MPNSSGSANPTAAWTFTLLYAMRVSAKLNLYLGVRNLALDFLPPRLLYLGSYFRVRRFNALMPWSLLAGAGVVAWLISAAAVLSAPAHAQDENIQEVVVTGSRIAAPNLTSTSPVQVVTSKEIQQQGRNEPRHVHGLHSRTKSRNSRQLRDNAGVLLTRPRRVVLAEVHVAAGAVRLTVTTA